MSKEINLDAEIANAHFRAANWSPDHLANDPFSSHMIYVAEVVGYNKTHLSAFSISQSRFDSAIVTPIPPSFRVNGWGLNLAKQSLSNFGLIIASCIKQSDAYSEWLSLCDGNTRIHALIIFSEEDFNIILMQHESTVIPKSDVVSALASTAKLDFKSGIICQSDRN